MPAQMRKTTPQWRDHNVGDVLRQCILAMLATFLLLGALISVCNVALHVRSTWAKFHAEEREIVANANYHWVAACGMLTTDQVRTFPLDTVSRCARASAAGRLNGDPFHRWPWTSRASDT
jgi:hypothetical protein